MSASPDKFVLGAAPLLLSAAAVAEAVAREAARAEAARVAALQAAAWEAAEAGAQSPSAPEDSRVVAPAASICSLIK